MMKSYFMDKIEKLNRIDKAVLANYDEISDHAEPYIYLSLADEGLAIPECYEATADEFVDELEGELQRDGTVRGVVLCFAHRVDDCIERTDEIDLSELDDDYLSRLVEVAEAHKGEHVGELPAVRDICRGQLIVTKSGKYFFYLFDENGDICEHEASSVDDARAQILAEEKRLGGLYNADGQLTNDW